MIYMLKAFKSYVTVRDAPSTGEFLLTFIKITLYPSSRSSSILSTAASLREFLIPHFHSRSSQPIFLRLSKRDWLPRRRRDIAVCDHILTIRSRMKPLCVATGIEARHSSPPSGEHVGENWTYSSPPKAD